MRKNRFASPRLRNALREVSFDDRAVCSAAEADPGGFVDALPPRVLSFGDGLHAVPLRALWDAA